MVLSTQSIAAAECLVSELESPDSTQRLSALHTIKDHTIGNPVRKLLFVSLGLLPRCRSLLEDPTTDTDLLTQCLPTVASCLSVVEDGDEAVACTTAVLAHLSHQDPKVATSALQALKNIIAHARWPIPIPEGLDDRLVALLASPLSPSTHPAVHEWAAELLAHVCCDQSRQHRLVERGAVEALTPLLVNPNTRLQHAALNCLAAVVRHNPVMADRVAGTPGMLPALFRAAKGPSLPAQLAAARVLAYLYPSLCREEAVIDVRVSVLPMVLRLLGAEDPVVRAEAPTVLSVLISDNEADRKSVV